MESKKLILWQELIESKDFDQLSNSEKAFVLGISDEENYRLERTAILEARIIYSEVEPRPLILEKEKKGIVIPLYQTILATAASFILGFLLFKSNQTVTEIKEKEPLAITDTVYVEKQVIDTVIQTKTEYIQVASQVSPPQEASNVKAAPSAVLSTQSDFEADLSSATLANKGKSASNDETLGLMEDWVGPN